MKGKGAFEIVGALTIVFNLEKKREISETLFDNNRYLLPKYIWQTLKIILHFFSENREVAFWY